MKANFASLLVAVLSMSCSVFGAPTAQSEPLEISLSKTTSSDPIKAAELGLNKYLAQFNNDKPTKRDTVPFDFTHTTSRLLGTVTIGTTDVPLIFDTGSADLNLDSTAYTPGSSAQDTHLTFSNAYGEGETTDKGEVYLDTVQLGSTTTQNVPTLLADSSWWKALPESKGIFGLSFLGDYHAKGYSSFLEEYFKQHTSQKQQFSTWVSNGDEAKLYLGGYDASKFSGSLTYTSVNPKYEWWLIPSGGKVDGKAASGLIDSGTPAIYAPNLATLRKIASDRGLQVYTQGNIAYVPIPCSAKQVKVSFNSLTRSIPNLPNGGGDNCVLPIFAFNNDGQLAGGNWIYGLPIYEQFFIVHDYENKRVGFATPNK